MSAIAYLSVFGCPVLPPALIWFGPGRKSAALRRHCIRAGVIQLVIIAFGIPLDVRIATSNGRIVHPGVVTLVALPVLIVVSVVSAILAWRSER